MSVTRTTPQWRALQMQRLSRLHPNQPAPLTAGEAAALLEDFDLLRQALISVEFGDAGHCAHCGHPAYRTHTDWCWVGKVTTPVPVANG